MQRTYFARHAFNRFRPGPRLVPVSVPYPVIAINHPVQLMMKVAVPIPDNGRCPNPDSHNTCAGGKQAYPLGVVHSHTPCPTHTTSHLFGNRDA